MTMNHSEIKDVIQIFTIIMNTIIMNTINTHIES